MHFVDIEIDRVGVKSSDLALLLNSPFALLVEGTPTRARAEKSAFLFLTVMAELFQFQIVILLKPFYIIIIITFIIIIIITIIISIIITIIIIIIIIIVMHKLFVHFIGIAVDFVSIELIGIL